MNIRIISPAKVIPSDATVHVGDQFETCPEPKPNLFPIIGSVTVLAPKTGGGTVKTWVLSGSWEEVPTP